MNIQVNENPRKSYDINLIKDLNTSILVDERFEKNNEYDLNTLVSMGFDIKMAKKVYVLLRPRNIDEVIYLLTQDDGKYHHYFIERHGNENECFICGTNREKHIKFIPKEKPRNSISNKNKNKDKLDKELNTLNEPLVNSEGEDVCQLEVDIKIKCEICDEFLSPKEIQENILPCKHFFCTDCYLNNFKEKIGNNGVYSIKCMKFECKEELNNDFIGKLLNGNNELYEKYLKFKKRNEIAKNPNLVPCPSENCESYAQKEENNQFVKCQKGHKFCSLCKEKWHKGKNCNIDEINSIIEDYHLKNCPSCGELTEKSLGCNHMKCKCGCDWCWFCKKPFKDENEHYGINGPCANLHFTQKEMYNNCCILCIHNTWIKVWHNILLLFVITSSLSAYFLRKYKRDFQEKTFNIFLRAMRLIGLVYSICFMPIFLIIGFPVFLFCICARGIRRRLILYFLDLDDRES